MTDLAPSMAGVADDYPAFEALVRDKIRHHVGPLFTTSADPDALWKAYLEGIPEPHRQHYNCSACGHFIRHFGGLVTIDADGNLAPLLWDPSLTPGFFEPAVEALAKVVSKAQVNGIFFTDEALGTAANVSKKGQTWTHLSGEFGWADVCPTRFPDTYTAAQYSAAKREEYKMLNHALADFGPDVAAEALRVLKSDTLMRSEKALGVAEWFNGLHERLKDSHKRQNLVWLAVAIAPPGFAHIRSTMIGTLLQDIQAGLSFADVNRRWADKMHPLQYQRPQAPPKAQAIEQAEALVEKLGVARSLERRFAMLDDVPAKLWVPQAPAQAKPGGVFGHLKARVDAVKALELPPVKMTWAKFKDVLCRATTMEVGLPSRGAYYGLVTAVHADAPNILQWDNPVSWYFYSSGSSPYQWGLTGSWGRVTAVFYPPYMWGPKEHTHHRKFVCFALAGAKDSGSNGLALFPETLKSEFHGIRAVIEAHSSSGHIGDVEGGELANGLAFDNNEVTVRVNGNETFILDRWD